MQRVEQRDQIAPEPAQHRLSAVVAEADVDRLLVDDAVEHVIDRVHRPGRVLRVLGDARLVQLHRVRLDQFELAPQHAGDVHRQIRDVRVVAVVQQPRQHVRPRARELERPGRQRPRELGVVRKVERSVADPADDDAGGDQVMARRQVVAMAGALGDREILPDPVHARQKVVDHPVGLGMARVETHELAVGDQVQPRQLLRLQHRHHRVAEDEPRRVADHPGQHGIAAHASGLDSRGHFQQGGV